MGESTLRDFAERHADAVVRGDMEAVADDFSDELRPQIPRLALVLPTPLTAAEVLSVDASATPAVVRIKFIGDGEVTVRSEWTSGDRPVISATTHS